MRAVIIGNGSIENYDYIASRLRADDYFICADGGLRHARHLGIRPDIAIGDFDSAARPDDVRVMEFPARKDQTDGELAVEYALERGYDEILLIAMSGTRLDHTLTNITLLSRAEKACLIDDNNEIYIVSSELKLHDYKGKTLSIIPLCGELEGITTSGLEYPLNNETLYFGTGRGNSNVVISDECSIRVTRGIGAVIINNGE